MVKNGHDEIPEVSYLPPGSDAVGVEVVSIAELAQRMRDSSPARTAERPDFHLLLAVHSGILWHMVDFQDVAATDRSWLWVRPGQVQRFGDLTGVTGTAVLFPPATLPPLPDAQIPLDDAFGPTLLTPDPTDRAGVDLALEHLRAEFDAADLPEIDRSTILRQLLSVLLLRLRAVPTPASAAGEPPEAFVRLRAAIEEEFATHRDVGHYARRLGYSPRTLTRASIQVAGVGAKELIDRRVVLEARRLLAHGEDPVGLVAARLGFDDASNFVAYFARQTGTTPAAFRRRFRSSAA